MIDSLGDKHHPNRNVSSARFVKRYFGFMSFAISIIIIAIFLGFHLRAKHLIEDTLLHQAQAFFGEIVITRQWIINSGGVYVKQRTDSTINHHLEDIEGLKLAITDTNGERYILKSHAAITHMISNIGQIERLVIFKITSLNPLNPINAPDKFETKALQQFENGSKESFTFEKTENGTYYRYMAPLFITKSCLQCHQAQGYKLGDIRGGICVSIPATDFVGELFSSRLYTILSGAGILGLVLAIIWYLSLRFIKAVERSESRLYEMATTDYLTGLPNRREGIRRFNQEISLSDRKNQPLSAIIIDIDHFKRINDSYGHQIGDEIIKITALTIFNTLRKYDIICRYGGEEFLIILPMTKLNKALEIAERLRKTVENTVTILDGIDAEIRLTISLGVSQHQNEENLDGLVTRVDSALYRAKDNGRNQAQTSSRTVSIDGRNVLSGSR